MIEFNYKIFIHSRTYCVLALVIERCYYEYHKYLLGAVTEHLLNKFHDIWTGWIRRSNTNLDN